MKRLLNTLYVTSGNKYLSLDGENVVVLEDQKEIGRIPLHNLQAIIFYKLFLIMAIQERVRRLWEYVHRGILICLLCLEMEDF